VVHVPATNGGRFESDHESGLTVYVWRCVLVLPGQPTSVRTRVIQPDTVLVSWQPPLDGGAVTGYMIGYGEGVPDVNWRYLERHRRNVTIRSLSE